MKNAPSQSQDKFIVRLPEGMRDQIKAAADANNRSMNAEVIARLELTFGNDTLDQFHALRLSKRQAELAEQTANITTLSAITEDLVEQISERIVAELTGGDGTITRPIGRISSKD